MTTGVEIRWGRLLLAPTLAAIPPAFFMLAMASSVGATHSDQFLLIAAAIIGASWFLLLVGTSLLAAIAAWQRRIRSIACYMLGTAVILLLPLVSVALVVRGAPIVMPETAKAGVAVPLAACLTGGLFGLPFGWLAGWIVWRLGFPSAAAQDTGRFSRTWNSLAYVRLTLSLCLLPSLPAVAIFALMAHEAHLHSDLWLPGVRAALLSLGVWIGGAALYLATIGGGAFLYVCSRRMDERVSLANCLTLGGAVAFLLPLASCALGFVLGIVIPPVSSIMSELFARYSLYDNLNLLALVGTILTPLGLPGGWLVWQIGVAPAPRPGPLDTGASVFD